MSAAYLSLVCLLGILSVIRAESSFVIAGSSINSGELNRFEETIAHIFIYTILLLLFTKRNLLRINFCASSDSCTGSDYATHLWPLPLSPPGFELIFYLCFNILIFVSVTLSAFNQIHILYDCMAVDGDISSQTGICHLFFTNEVPSFEVLDAGWRYDLISLIEPTRPHWKVPTAQENTWVLLCKEISFICFHISHMEGCAGVATRLVQQQ